MRLRPTHEATVTMEVQVGTGETGTPLHDDRPIFTTPVRFHSPGGQSFVRTASGELVQEQPTVVFPVHATPTAGYGTDYGDYDGGEQLLVGEHIEEGATISLDSRTGEADWTADTDATFQADAVDVKRRRGGRPERVELTVQRNP